MDESFEKTNGGKSWLDRVICPLHNQSIDDVYLFFFPHATANKLASCLLLLSFIFLSLDSVAYVL